MAARGVQAGSGRARRQFGVSPRHPFVLESLRVAPAEAGIYVLWHDVVALYIGHVHANGKSIRSLLMAHYVCEVEPFEATHFSFEIAADPAGRARQYLKEYRAANHYVPRWNEARVERA